MRRHHGRAPSPFAGRTPSPPSAEVTLVRSFDHDINPSRPARQSPLAASQFGGMPLDLIDRIRSFPLFQTAPDAFLFDVGLVLKPQLHKANDYIMTEGDDAKAMYWIVRGAVAVTSRDGESTYAELKPGSFVGEIGILMDRPRTATVVARTKCLTLQLKKEDLRRILPTYPDVERALREEALERIAILEKKKRQTLQMSSMERRGSKRARDESDVDARSDDNDENENKRRKSPSPGVNGMPSVSALGHGLVNVRTLLKELPLFSNLPAGPLHFLGLNAQPTSYPPFTNIFEQDSTGREVYFIVHGEVEVVNEHPQDRGRRRPSNDGRVAQAPEVVARLKSGQYFGEVVSLSLASRRTATVRSVTTVECLVIPESVLKEFWEHVPKEIKHEIEDTAKSRLRAAEDDVYMTDADTLSPNSSLEEARQKLQSRQSKITFHDAEQTGPIDLQRDDPTVAEPLDPDPLSSSALDSVIARRRGSLPPTPLDGSPHAATRRARKSPRHSPISTPVTSPVSTSSLSFNSTLTTPSPTVTKFSSSQPFTTDFSFSKATNTSSVCNRGSVPDEILLLAFQWFELHELMKLQAVSRYWRSILARSDKLFHNLDLSKYNRRITDHVLATLICPLVGSRPTIIDISNCFHVTDTGFAALIEHCGANLRILRMKSVWEVTASAILEMSVKARHLVEIDLSNCRKVSDILLARMLGWIVQPSPQVHRPVLGRNVSSKTRPRVKTNPSDLKPPLETVGCQSLNRLTLSYCKHVTDRTMHHIALHASKRLAHLDLTRCTTITDIGFQHWSQSRNKFHNLATLVLADCTYLSDQAIINLVNCAGQSLRTLDLTFCCALSDISTEVVAMHCPNLENLDMSFCGSAISDTSLRVIGRHLSKLLSLSVRGCVRVTGLGVDEVVKGCTKLERMDVSQCKNLVGWIRAGGAQHWKDKGRRVVLELAK